MKGKDSSNNSSEQGMDAVYEFIKHIDLLFHH